MRILCVSAQLPGHLDWGGYLLTAAELQRRGHSVLWVSGPAVRQAVERAGVTFQTIAETGWRWPPPPPLPPPAQQGDPAWLHQRSLRALDQWLDETRVLQAAAQLAEVVAGYAPDLIVSEMFVAAAGIVAEQAGRPLVVAGWPALAASPGDGSELAQLARKRLERILAATGTSGANWTPSGPPMLRSGRLHLSYWSPSWYAGQNLLEQTRHAGGCRPEPLPPIRELPSPHDRPWVLITLGTSFNDDPNFFMAAAQAADRLGCLPIVVPGPSQQSAPPQAWLARLPKTSVVLATVQFAEVLPYTAAAIHHGGAGTTHALVTNAVPQVVVPHAADQMHQASGVARTGAGIHLPARQATVDALVASLAAVLPDLSACRSRATALQAEFAALGGVPRAADLIEQIRS